LAMFIVTFFTSMHRPTTLHNMKVITISFQTNSHFALRGDELNQEGATFQ
jgi:hypothetical protein